MSLNANELRTIKNQAIEYNWSEFHLIIRVIDYLIDGFSKINSCVNQPENQIQETKNKPEIREIPRGYILVNEFQKNNLLCKKLGMNRGRLIGMIRGHLEFFKEILFIHPKHKYHHKYFIDEKKTEELLLNFPYKNQLEKQVIIEYKREFRQIKLK
jgi:hypothetical protein